MAVEPEASDVSNSSGEQEKGEGDDAHVAEIQEHRHDSGHVQLGQVVPNRIKQHVASAGAGGQEGAPPPPVVLVAELEVAQEDGHLGTGDDQHHHHQEQEPKGQTSIMNKHMSNN